MRISKIFFTLLIKIKTKTKIKKMPKIKMMVIPKNLTVSTCILLMTLNSVESVYACASSSYESSYFGMVIPNRPSFFSSELGSDLFFQEFNFITHPSAENTGEDENKKILTRCLGPYCSEPQKENDKNANLSEWKEFLKNNLLSNETSDLNHELTDLIYKIDLNLLVKINSELQQSNEISSDLTKNSLLKNIVHHKRLDILTYLIYAKKSESFSVNAYNPWDKEYLNYLKTRDPENMKLMIQDGLKNYKESTDDFLKLRYAYQVIRAANYAKEFDLCVKYYDELIPPLKSQSVYVYHSLRHKAGALLKLGKSAEVLLNLGVIFDQSPLLMSRVLYNDYFDPDPEVWAEAMKMLKGKPHQQATLWAIRALKESSRIDLKSLQSLYQLEPQSSRTEFFLNRYINILERNFLTYDFLLRPESLNKELLNSMNSYLQDFSQFLSKVDKNKVRRPSYWYLASAYSSLLLKNFDQAENELKQVKKNLSINQSPEKISAIEMSSSVLEVLITIMRTPTHEASGIHRFENQLIPVLSELKGRGGHYNWTSIRQSLLLLVAQKYLSLGIIDKAYFAFSMAGFPDLTLSFLVTYTSPQDLQKFISYQQQPHKSGFDQLITQNPLFTIDDLLYIKATKHLVNEELQESLETVNKIQSDIKDKKEISTTFKDNFYHLKTGLYDLEREKFPKFSKKEFIEKLIELKNEASQKQQRGQDPGIYHYQMANAFFHNPFWRYFHSTISPWQNKKYKNYPIYESYIDDANHPLRNSTLNLTYKIFTRENFHDQDSNRYLAWKYYDQVINETQDQELAAKSSFMAAAAQKKFAYSEGFEPKDRGIKYYYELLKNKYSKTRYYDRIIEECASFKNYLGKKD